MDKDGSLRINKWEFGIGQSPHLGFGQMVNVDIFSQPGAVKISNKLERDGNSVDIVDGFIKWSTQDPNNGDLYFVDGNGKLYKRDLGTDTWSVITGHGTSAARGQGIAIWKDYLFYARATKLDVYGPLSGSPSWDNNWQTLTSATNHPMMAAQDDFLYIGNAQYVDTINEATPPFDPANGATYTYNAEDLELRSNYQVTCLEQLGSDIVIGTIIDNNVAIADMFFWDGTSDSFVLNKTIRFAEDGVIMTKNINNILYTLPGTGIPRLMKSVTAQAVEAKRLNNIQNFGFGNRIEMNANAIEQYRGELIFGVGQDNVNNIYPLGVYSFRNDAYVLRNIISTGSDGSTDGVKIGTITMSSAQKYVVTWKDDSRSPNRYGADILSENFYDDFSAYIESPLYTVATVDDPKTFEKVQIIMGKNLNTGDQIRIKARKALDEDWTKVCTIGSQYVGRTAFDAKFENLGKFTDIQIRIEMKTASNATESPELREVKLT